MKTEHLWKIQAIMSFAFREEIHTNKNNKWSIVCGGFTGNYIRANSNLKMARSCLEFSKNYFECVVFTWPEEKENLIAKQHEDWGEEMYLFLVKYNLFFWQNQKIVIFNGQSNIDGSIVKFSCTFNAIFFQFETWKMVHFDDINLH